MKYKGNNKIYFGIGVRDDYMMHDGRIIFFYWFKMISKPPEGQVMIRGENYKGFMWEKRVLIPTFRIEI